MRTCDSAAVSSLLPLTRLCVRAGNAESYMYVREAVLSLCFPPLLQGVSSGVPLEMVSRYRRQRADQRGTAVFGHAGGHFDTSIAQVFMRTTHLDLGCPPPPSPLY